MSEHTVAIVSFEGAVKREIKRIREQLGAIDSLSDFEFVVRASGRINDGAVQISYRVAGKYGDNDVTGNSVGPVIEEFMRRHGWKAVHAPKLLGYEKIPGDDSVPF